MIAAKWKRHNGPAPVPTKHQPDKAAGNKGPRKWPKFDKDAVAPVLREPVT